MTTTVETETILDASTFIIVQVTGNGDEAVSEQDVLDVSALSGPDGLTLARTSLMEAKWNLSSTFESAKLYWTDEGNDEVIINMSGDGAWDGSGFGGLASPDEVAQATDQDVELDVANATETAGTFDITLVFKKKQD